MSAALGMNAGMMAAQMAADAAAMARRLGAEVTILYRRTREEMPAIEREIEEALEENIDIVYLAAPKEIMRDDEGKLKAMVVQRMALWEKP